MSTTSKDAWKDLASRMKTTPSKAGPAVQQMISRMNDLYPFSTAQGIFDNGSGGGSIISHILASYGAELSTTTSILAGDFSEAMLDVLRAKKQAQIDTGDDIWGRLQIRKLDAHNLQGVEDDSISHVTGGHVYFLLDEPPKALRETYRVLCPGGLLGLTSGKSSQHIDALCAAVETVKPGTGLRLLKEPWSSEEGVEGELRACGFGDVETFLVESTMGYSNIEEFADILLSMPVMNETLTKFSVEKRKDLLADLVVRLREMDRENAGTLSGVNIVAIGRKATR